MNKKQIERDNAEYKGSIVQCKFDKRGHEVYGEKPEKFTKEWWPYFFEYYKVHVISCILGVLLIGITAYQIATTVDYDCTIAYDGTGDGTAAEAAIAEQINDVTENGVKDVMFTCYGMKDSVETYDEYTMAIQQKFMLELTEGESYLYIISQNNYDKYCQTAEDSLFMPCEEWLGKTVVEDKLVKTDDIAYGVRIDGCKKLEEYGINTQGKIMVMKQMYERHMEKPEHTGFLENAKTVAAFLLE